MASCIMHIAIAEEIYKKINDKSCISYQDYILGSIAADISKLVGEDKDKAHFITDNSEVPNIILFLEKYRDSLSNSFNLGYYIHLYTDKLFYEEYLPLFITDDILKSSVRCLDGNILDLSLDERMNLLYNDYTNLNLKLIDEYNLNLDIFYNEFRKPITEIEEIDSSKLDILINNMGNIIANSKNDKSYIIDISSIKTFIDVSAKEIYDNLVNLKIIS